MQTIGYIIENKSGDKIKILIRQAKYGRYLKLRKSGSDGNHFADEEIFLNEPKQSDRLNKLKNNEVIFC